MGKSRFDSYQLHKKTTRQVCLARGDFHLTFWPFAVKSRCASCQSTHRARGRPRQRLHLRGKASFLYLLPYRRGVLDKDETGD